jgi:aquaporin Z
MSTSVRIGVAEAIGTAILVIGGPGTAILAGDVVGGTLGVSLAFGFSLLCAAYAIGSISGCHINPAVTVGSWVLGKTNASLVPFYIVGQVVGGIVGALAIFVIANGRPGFNAEESGFASNGWANHSPGGFDFSAMVVTEIVLTGLFVLVVLTTSRKSMAIGFTGITVGLMLALVHLVSIPVDNTSVNPARSLATAVFQADWALEQLWAFIVFPLIGGIIAGIAWKVLVPPADE